MPEGEIVPIALAAGERVAGARRQGRIVAAALILAVLILGTPLLCPLTLTLGARDYFNIWYVGESVPTFGGNYWYVPPGLSHEDVAWPDGPALSMHAIRVGSLVHLSGTVEYSSFWISPPANVRKLSWGPPKGFFYR